MTQTSRKVCSPSVIEECRVSCRLAAHAPDRRRLLPLPVPLLRAGVHLDLPDPQQVPVRQVRFAIVSYCGAWTYVLVRNSGVNVHQVQRERTRNLPKKSVSCAPKIDTKEAFALCRNGTSVPPNKDTFCGCQLYKSECGVALSADKNTSGGF